MKRTGIIVAIILSIGLITSLGCDGVFNLVIENQTTQALTVQIDRSSLGVVAAGGKVEANGLPMTVNTFSIVAKNANGETIFSKTFSRQQMQVVDNTTYKVVITTQP